MQQIIEALYVAAGIGQVIAVRASIAGASGGCQAEIGTASAMAAGACVQLKGGTDSQIAQASAMVLQANEDAIETLKANGATITDIDRTALYELCKPLYEEFANDRIPTELVEMVNAAK